MTVSEGWLTIERFIASFRDRSIWRTALSVLLVSASAGGLTACGDSWFEGFGEESRELAATPALLDDRVYAAPNSYILGQKLADHTEVKLAFDGSTITASAGCQTARGQYTLRNGRLRAPALTTSGRPCSNSTAEQEKWLVDFLRGPIEAIVGSDEAHVLSIGNRKVSLEMVALDLDEPDLSKLRSRGWSLNQFKLSTSDKASQTAVAIPGLADYNKTQPGASLIPDLTFDEDEFRLFSGCGGVEGRFSFNESSIDFEPVAESTERCKGPSEKFHEKLAPLFNGSFDYRIAGPDLILTKGQTVLRFFSG